MPENGFSVLSLYGKVLVRENPYSRVVGTKAT